MFLSESRIRSAGSSASKQIGFGIVLTFLWLVGLFSVITDDPNARTHGSSTLSMIAVDLAMLLLSLFLLFVGINKKKTISKAKKLANIFDGDEDGVLIPSETAVLMGMPEHKFMSLFDKCIAREYIINASLNNENGIRILLTRNENKSADTECLKCPECGASTDVRKGYSGKCQYCGSPLERKNET